MNEANKNSIAKNLKYILVLVGVVALVLAYFLSFQKYSDKTEDIQTEIDSLQLKCDDLESKNNSKEKIEGLTAEAEMEYGLLLDSFGSAVTYQSEIMDNYEMGENLQIQIPSLQLSPSEPVYVFGQLASSNPNGGTAGMDAGYTGVAMSYSITTVGTYDQMKQTLNYIMNEEGKRKVPITIAFAYDTTEQKVALTISIKEYAITGEDRTPEEIVVPGYQKSTTNIFYNEILKLD